MRKWANRSCPKNSSRHSNHSAGESPRHTSQPIWAGELVLIEINDGGTSGIPPFMDPRECYAALLDTE
ncbi:MAG: hypothetical protein CMO80_16560 [Verrucomicrobiales bacterium]|nr:hypothetical protein [Verrucomicrobiales bacterium]